MGDIKEYDVEKIQRLITLYKKDFGEHWENEKYKWQAIKHFQDNWDINAADFGSMFEEATALTANLLAVSWAFPRGMVINFAKAFNEEVRDMFVNLYDENIDLETRMSVFTDKSKELLNRHNNSAVNEDIWKNHYQDPTYISTYLWLRYPDKYYIYKYQIYKTAAETIGYPVLFKKGDGIKNVIKGFDLYDIFNKYLKDDIEVRKLLTNFLTNDCYLDKELKTLTVDFGYYISKYLEHNINQNEKQINEMKHADYICLLRSNRNLILTGAPGTGKTYMAKEIAKEMIGAESIETLGDDEHYGFVQFHPSYDYTDFVEGLRPTEDNGFELKNGVFKEFCLKAMQNYNDSKKSKQTLEQELSVKDIIDDFIDNSIENNVEFKTSGTKNAFHIIASTDRSIHVEVPGNEKTKVVKLPKSDLITLLDNEVSITGGKDIQIFFNRKYRTQQDSYTYVLLKEIRKLSSKKKKVEVQLVPLRNYVFVIDEINRGEISKIFGELFFSIDPGYRGEKGLANTQYQNMIEEGDLFKNGFFVPENVYIIGTMNDIDRSVESMDFAMRRRFAWKEITAEMSMSMLDTLEMPSDTKQILKNRMRNLNEAILNINGLNESYQIGAAYFMKYADYNDFEKLWDYHLRGLLFEYLRGSRNADADLKALKEAYDNEAE